MQRILFVAIFLLSLMVCLTPPVWAGGLDDAKAGVAAAAAGDYDKAIRLYTKAIESGALSRKDLSKVYYNRGNAWIEKVDYRKGIDDYTKAMENDPGYAAAYNKRGLARYGTGDNVNVIADYTNAIKLDPRYADAYYNRGNAWGDRGDDDKAIADLTKAIEINPKYANAYYNRGNAWVKKGDYDKAIIDYTKAIEINPKHTFAYYNRGNAWVKKGDYNKAREINPKQAFAYNGLAWLMATYPEGRYRNGKRAVELAEKAVALKDDANFLDTLAAAYAEAGRFQEAIKTQERAMTKLKQEGGAKSLPKYEEHLSSYKAGKPWREK
jgi:tetratricopeptide (TPR) repeat protein